MYYTTNPTSLIHTAKACMPMLVHYYFSGQFIYRLERYLVSTANRFALTTACTPLRSILFERAQKAVGFAIVYYTIHRSLVKATGRSGAAYTLALGTLCPVLSPLTGIMWTSHIYVATKRGKVFHCFLDNNSDSHVIGR